MISHACCAAGFTPKLAYQGSQVNTVIHLVAAGFGVALVPACDMHTGVVGAAFLQLGPEAPTVTFNALMRRSRPTPLAARLTHLMLSRHAVA